MPDLNGTRTHDNLKAAFAGEFQANRRYLYFAKIADVEGHLHYLKRVGAPATGLPIGESDANLRGSVAGKTHEYTEAQDWDPRALDGEIERA